MRFAPLIIALLVVSAHAADDGSKSLFRRVGSSYGWDLSEGKEFPGAKGVLGADKKAVYEGNAPLRLKGDFSEGGGYVAALLDPPPMEPGVLDMMIRVDTKPVITLRFTDASDQVHQYRYKLEETTEWQRLRVPLQDLFDDQDARAANERVVTAEHWGGKADNEWHGTLKRIAIMLSREQLANGDTSGNFWIAAPRLIPAVSPPEKGPRTIRVSDFVSPAELNWRFDNGKEFAGATGSLELARDEDDTDAMPYMRLSGDFSEGGAYVQCSRGFELPEGAAITEIRLKLRSQNVDDWTLRLIDGSGQCHQHRGLRLKSNGQWQSLVLKPEEFASEKDHWSGKNDGKWHGGLKTIAILTNARSGGKKKAPVLDIMDVEVDVAQEVAAGQ